MRKNDALLFSCEPYSDGEGRIARAADPRGGVKGIMVPVGSELAAREFGFAENVSHRFFCKEENPHLLAGNMMRYDGRDYTIVHVADYGRIKVVHLNTLIGRKNVRSVTQNLRY
ncbi:MAG: hypothetical protein LBH54_02605 [Clostridiales bacterium]|jgi:hypothetical protein|nr:hypothetical protein [Clostridiales bacterium]